MSDTENNVISYFNRFEVLANGNFFILSERSLMKKAILVTADNKGKLAQQYAEDQDDFDDAIGFWLIADFGSDHYEALLNQATFDSAYETAKFDDGTEVKILNGFTAIVPKGVVNP